MEMRKEEGASHVLYSEPKHTIAAVTLFGYSVSLYSNIFSVMPTMYRWPILGPDSACLEVGLFLVKLLELFMYFRIEFGSELFQFSF